MKNELSAKSQKCAPNMRDPGKSLIKCKIHHIAIKKLYLKFLKDKCNGEVYLQQS